MSEGAVQEANETTASEESESKDEDDLELDITDPAVQLVMRAYSIEIQQLILTNGTVYQVNQPWPGPDGQPVQLHDDKGQPIFIEENGEKKPRHLLIGGIFFIEEVSTTTQDTGDDDEDDDDEDDDDANEGKPKQPKLPTMVTARNPAHYEVWTEPAPLARRKRIPLDQVAEDEAAVPQAWGADTVMTERLPDQLTISVTEAIELAERYRKSRNGQSSQETPSG